MKVYLNKSVRELDHAAAWLGNEDHCQVLDDLETKIRELERSWGDCSIFVECTLPRLHGIRSQQLDLLIAFKDRAALCEVKRGYRDNVQQHKIDDTQNQIQGQLDIVCEHIADANLNPKSLYAILWCPNIARHEELSRIIHLLRNDRAFRHITATGGLTAFHNVRLPDTDGAVYAYLPEEIHHRLSKWDGTHPATEPYSLAGSLAYSFQSAQPLLQLTGFAAARHYLHSMLPHDHTELIPDATHVGGLHRSSLEQACRFLGETKFLEVVGPQGVGKSTFIKDVLIRYLNANPRKYELCIRRATNKKDLHRILRWLADEAGLIPNEESASLNCDALLRALGNEDAVYWIDDYDLKSLDAVFALREQLKSSARRYRAFWVLESVVPRDSDPIGPVAADESCRVHLKPLEDREIAAILAKHSGGDGDLSEIINAACGIPRIAIMRWTLPKGTVLPKSDRLEQYDLFLHHLKPDERKVLVSIAFILDNSPLGTTIRLVEEWCATVGGHSPRQVREVLLKCRESGLISLELFGDDNRVANGPAPDPGRSPCSEAVGGASLLRMFMPTSIREARFGWINVLDPHFVEHYIRGIGDEIGVWKSKLEEVLISGARNEDLSLTGVTFHLLCGDFEPFVRSSFLSSSAVLPRLSDWLEARDDPFRIEPNRDTVFFRRWLSNFPEVYWDNRSQRSTSEWPLPDAGSRFQTLLFDIIRTRGVMYRRGDDDDWDSWTQTAVQFERSGQKDLWAETLIRQAQTLIRPPYDNPERAWNLLRTVLLKEEELSPQAGQPVLYFHVLSFLNKRKVWNKRVPQLENEAASLTSSIGLRMIDRGIAMENVTTIANALFFLSRSFETENRPTNRDEMDTFLACLRFVERISPARRIQAMLTQGSIHRHYCSENNVDWTEYRQHADEALEIYKRALASSVRMNSPTHSMNALTYSGNLLVKAARFRNEPDVRFWLKGYLPTWREHVENFIALSEKKANGQGRSAALEQNLLFNVHNYRVLFQWFSAVVAKLEDAETLPSRLSDLFCRLATMCATLDRAGRSKQYQQVLVVINRMVTFTYDDGQHSELLKSCRAPLVAFLDQIDQMVPKDPRFRRKSKLLKHAEQMVESLVKSGVPVPERFIRSLQAT